MIYSICNYNSHCVYGIFSLINYDSDNIYLSSYVFLYTACKGRGLREVSSDKESITSPLYPENYPQKQSCTWQVTAPPDHVVGFQLIDFDLSSEDYLELRGGKDQRQLLMKLLRSSSNETKLKHWWTTNGQFLMIKFMTKSTNIISKGFKLRLMFAKYPQG